MTARMDESTVGSYWLDEHGRIWRQIAYAAQPTATLELVDKSEVPAGSSGRLTAVVGAPLFAPFVRLKEEL